MLQQNFLRDEWLGEGIVLAAGVGPDDVVVEFGAGAGALTRPLARAARRVVAVELDPFWAARLERRFTRDGNVEVVNADASSVALPEGPFRVVANVPFYLTTALLHRLLDDPASPPDPVHLLVQREVARKHARPSPTTLKTLRWSPWYEMSVVLELPPTAFRPVPEVGACLMRAAKRGPPLVEPSHRHLFRALVRQAFDGRGNAVGRTLRSTFTKTQLRRLAADNGFRLDAPPSWLTAHQWAAVFAFMLRAVPPSRWPAAGL